MRDQPEPPGRRAGKFQLAEMYDERAQLELAYATQLRAWSRKWHNELTKSQEYGTNKQVWDQNATTGKEISSSYLY